MSTIRDVGLESGQSRLEFECFLYGFVDEVFDDFFAPRSERAAANPPQNPRIPANPTS